MSSRRAVRTLAIAAITGLGITSLAAPVSADTTLALTYISGDPGQAANWSLSGDSAYGTSFTFDNNSTAYDVYLQTDSAGTISLGAATCTQSTGPNFCPVSKSTTGVVFTIEPGVSPTQIEVRQAGNVIATFTVSSDAPPSPSSISDDALAPPTYDLTFDPTETGASCSVAGVSAPRGTWVTVEAASGCVAPRSNPTATLLGWATNPDFSVEIAQRQIDNGWGAYETFNSDGELTGVFIPAGGTTLLTSPRNLHAIWSN